MRMQNEASDSLWIPVRADSTVPTMRPELNQNESQPNATEFARWFGASKVTDQASGCPLVVYHDTASNCVDFDYGRGAMYFTDEFEIALAYANQARNWDGDDVPRVVKAYLSLQNPLIVDEDWAKENLDDEDGERDWTVLDDILCDAKKNGYDGAILRGVVDYAGRDRNGKRLERPTNQYIAFEYWQAKKVAQVEVSSRSSETVYSMDAIGAGVDNGASAGPPLPAFDDWFKGSKVVSKGKPRKMYHGSLYAPSDFPANAVNWATSSAADAFDYAGTDPGAHVRPLYMQIHNPADLDRDQKARGALRDAEINPEDLFEVSYSDKTVSILRESGYDGIKVRRQDIGSGVVHYAAFGPEQIRSTLDKDAPFFQPSTTVGAGVRKANELIEQFLIESAAPALSAEPQSEVRRAPKM